MKKSYITKMISITLIMLLVMQLFMYHTHSMWASAADMPGDGGKVGVDDLVDPGDGEKDPDGDKGSGSSGGGNNSPGDGEGAGGGDNPGDGDNPGGGDGSGSSNGGGDGGDGDTGEDGDGPGGDGDGDGLDPGSENPEGDEEGAGLEEESDELMLMAMTRIELSPAEKLMWQIREIAWLEAIVSDGGTAVTVTGSNTTATPITLDIDSGLTVNWNAIYTGSVKVDYLINLTGSGAFVVGSDGPGYISNPGSGGAILVPETGGGATITVNNGEVSSDTGGNGIRIEASNTTVNVQPKGTVLSLANDTNAAIQVVGGVQGTYINVNGGSVVSNAGGYAISDGSTSPVNNNTTITVNSGRVAAERASAIHSSGTGSTVTIYSGIVSNSATSNANAAIIMNGGQVAGFTNVAIYGGKVITQGETVSSYAIQTNCNILVDGGSVIATLGRTINLVGENSVATIKSGSVSATTGTAICTATSDPKTVPNASVVIEGGSVSATGNGTAINVTGANAAVTVSGGTVSAENGIAINANTANSSPNINISGGSVSSDSGNAITFRGNLTISGGLVSSRTGNAIHATIANSKVIISGGQVLATTGFAVSNTGTGSAVTVNGGFVFAYGGGITGAGNVINCGNFTASGDSVVVAWNDKSPVKVHAKGTWVDLKTMPAGLPKGAVTWYGDGIIFSNGLTSGYLSLGMTVLADYGLIFDASTGYMYMDVDGSGTLDDNNINHPYTTGEGSLWSGEPGKLWLNGFNRTTKNGTALYIVNGDVTINLTGDNYLVSTSCYLGTEDYPGDNPDSHGISSGGNISIEGSGALTAIGGAAGSGGTSYGIKATDLTITGGALTVQGYTQAINIDSDEFPVKFPSFAYWTKTNLDESDGDAKPGEDETFANDAAYKFVKIRPAKYVTYGATQVGGLSGRIDSSAIFIRFTAPISGLTEDVIHITNGSGKVVPGTLFGLNDIYYISLASVEEEGDVTVSLDDFDDYVVSHEPRAVKVYKDSRVFTITLNQEDGGIASVKLRQEDGGKISEKLKQEYGDITDALEGSDKQTVENNSTTNASEGSAKLKLEDGGAATVSEEKAKRGSIIELEIESLEKNYSFVRWDFSSPVLWVEGEDAANKTAQKTSFFMPEGDVTVTPVYSYKGGNGGDGSGSGNSGGGVGNNGGGSGSNNSGSGHGNSGSGNNSGVNNSGNNSGGSNTGSGNINGVNNSNAGNVASESHNARTGDNFTPGLWFFYMLLGLVLCSLIAYYRICRKYPVIDIDETHI